LPELQIEENRRRDSHPHEPHYGCGAFLSRATPAAAGVQGIEPCLAVLEAACSPGAHSYRSMCLAGIEPGTPRFTASYADHYTTDTVNQRKGWESNPQGLAARSRSRRGPSPGRVARPLIVPGGIEPPISSVSGRRLGHSTTGLSVPRPGVEPGLPRSKRGVMSVSPPGHPAEGEGVEPAFPARGNRVSTAARPPVSGYLPFRGDGGNRTHPSLFARQTRPPLVHASPIDRQSSRVGSNHRSPPYQRGVFPLDHRTSRVAEAGFEPASYGL
jgi:hypothetical protein